jgi:hypothetical protein
LSPSVAEPSRASKSTDELKAVLPVLVTVKTYCVVPVSPSLCVTSAIEKLGAVTVIATLTGWLSTVTVATAELPLVEVKIELAVPEEIVPVAGIIVPLVAL